LGQSAATAAALALDSDLAVQDVPYADLRARLLEDDQVLGNGTDPGDFEGTVVDDGQATLSGDWTVGTSTRPFVGAGYRHDANLGKGTKTARFVATLPAAGHYEVRLAYTVNANRATNVPVSIEHSGGTASVVVNQQTAPTIEGVFAVVGEYDFGTSAAVEIATTGTDGHVIIDAVQFVAK
jgi:hypothetical protein